MVGLNATNVTLDDVNYLLNSSSMAELFVKVNNTVFSGWLWFILLWVLFIIVLFTLQKREDQLLINAMYSLTLITILSLILRAVTVVVSGVSLGLLSDFQMWVFPLLTAFLAMIVWASKS